MHIVFFIFGVLCILAGIAVVQRFGRTVIKQANGEESLLFTYEVASIGLLLSILGDFLLLRSGNSFLNSHGDGLILTTGIVITFVMSLSYKIEKEKKSS